MVMMSQSNFLPDVLAPLRADSIQLRADKTRKWFVCHARTGQLNATEAESSIAI